jgi:acyl-CoA synthetase (NDP forming)
MGSPAAGRRAALAHTAHDAGDAEAYARALACPGLLRAADQEQMIGFALALSRTARPARRRVGVVTVSGGAGTWLADDLVDAGLQMPVLSDGLQRQLRELIPAYGSPVSQVDATAQVLSTGGVRPVVRLG